MKGLVSISALALALAPVVALAQQPAPATPPRAAQPAPDGPAAAPAPAAPATTPGAPGPGVDASQPNAGAAPAAPPADTTATSAPKDTGPEPLIWRGTTLTWTTGASTGMVGLGSDQIGFEEDYLGMDWVLAPQLFLLDLKDDKIILSAEAGVTLEVTDSGTTTKKREPQFRDTQLGVAYNRNIWESEDKEWATRGSVRARAVFPTSPASLHQGRYLVSSLGVALTQQIRLLGNEADGLNNLTIQPTFTWSHLFARSYQPTDEQLNRPRQSASGANIVSDVLSPNSMDIDRLIPGVTFILPLYKDFSFSTAFRLIGRFKHRFEGNGADVCQDSLGGCIEADRFPEGQDVAYTTNSTFDAAFTVPIYDVVGLNIGYNNETLTLGEDGKNRNIFWSPSAQFYVDLVANIDIIYSKAAGREDFELPPGPSNSGGVASSTTGMPSF